MARPYFWIVAIADKDYCPKMGWKLNREVTGVDAKADGMRCPRKMTSQRISQMLRHPDAATLILGLVIGLGVCAPLLGGGRLFLLDWTVGPHDAIDTPAALGLNGGLTTGIGGSVIFAILNNVFGSASTWLPMLAFFPIATVGAGRLAGRSRWSRCAAGTLYAVNPFVFNRLFVGHFALLIGYALLPFAVKAAIRSLSSRGLRWCVPALWWAGLTSLSPHFAWIYGLVVLGVAIVAVSTKQHPLRRVTGWFATCVGAFALMSTYIILPNGSTNLSTQIGSVSLNLYRTNGDPHLGLFANVLALYGFWRTGPGPELPKDVIIGWPFIMFAILVIVGVGAWYALRRIPVKGEATDSTSETEGESTTGQSLGPTTTSIAVDETVNQSNAVDQRRLAILLVFVGVAGYFLALGNQGPTGGLFLWAYDHVPFFSIMREPQKFLMLLALAYAILFGWGVERLSQVDVSPTKVGAAATAALIGVVLPLGYCATIFDGLAGQVTSSPLPPAYQRADALMGTGTGNILVLPWHIYLEYPFTSGRVIANVGPTSFRRNVISGDNVQADDVQTQSTSPRSAYLQQLFLNGSKTNNFGALVAPLGVRYVVLSKAVDWPAYSWLNHQKDLKLVLDDQSLEVWRNVAYRGVGQRVTKLTSVSGIAGLLSLAKLNELGAGAVVRSESAPGVATSVPGVTSSPASTTLPSVRQLSPVAYRISSGTPGWVTVDTTYQRGWSFDGHAAKATAEGTVLVRVGAQGGVLEYTPWRLVRLGYIISAGTFVALALVLIVEPRRRKRTRVRVR
jgi:hypothetical protein